MQFVTKYTIENVQIVFSFETRRKEKLMIKENEVNCEVKIKNEVKKLITNFIREIIEKLKRHKPAVRTFWVFFLTKRRNE